MFYAFQVVTGKFENILKKALSKSWMFAYFKLSKY